MRKKADFDRAWKQGRGFFLKQLGVKFLKNQGLGRRYGIIVSTKISKLAVTRNLIKRRLRAMIREWQEKMTPDVDVVIIARSGLEKISYAETKAQALAIFERLNIIKSEANDKNK